MSQSFFVSCVIFFLLSHIKKNTVFLFHFESVSVGKHFKNHKDLDPQEFQATPEQTSTGKGIPNPLMVWLFQKANGVVLNCLGEH